MYDYYSTISDRDLGGWSFCYVAGSALRSDQLAPPERARIQGLNDLLVGLASAVGSLGSGVMFATLGYRLIGHISTAFSMIPLAATSIWFQGRRRRVQTAVA